MSAVDSLRRVLMNLVEGELSDVLAIRSCKFGSHDLIVAPTNSDGDNSGGLAGAIVGERLMPRKLEEKYRATTATAKIQPRMADGKPRVIASTGPAIRDYADNILGFLEIVRFTVRAILAAAAEHQKTHPKMRLLMCGISTRGFCSGNKELVQRVRRVILEELAYEHRFKIYLLAFDEAERCAWGNAIFT